MPFIDHPSIKCHVMQWAISLAEKLYKAYEYVYPNVFEISYYLISNQIVNFSSCDEN